MPIQGPESATRAPRRAPYDAASSSVERRNPTMVRRREDSAKPEARGASPCRGAHTCYTTPDAAPRRTAPLAEASGRRMRDTDYEIRGNPFWLHHFGESNQCTRPGWTGSE